jgi:hypothetical protein
MKKIFLPGIILLLAGTLLGQVPASFKYQAVLRDARGNIRANTATSIIIEILQGSAAGTVVYSETHNITTDGYGLINLDLGKGTATISSMSLVNWNTGIYFVKVTVDGSVMGTSQLLSVPYALYSDKAGNGFSGNYADLINKPTLANGTVSSVTGTAPVNVSAATTSPVISMAMANGTTNGYLSSTDWLTFNNKSSFTGTWTDISGKPTFSTVATSGIYSDLLNKPTTDGSETVVNSGTNINVTGRGTSGNPYVINTTVHKLGDEYGGGIVFFVYDGGQHGLIAAKADLFGGQIGNDPYYRWFNLYCPNGCLNFESGVKGDGLGAGAMNTTLIVASQLSYYAFGFFNNAIPDFAAKVCADYDATVTTPNGDITFGDWYLPSKFELDLLYRSQDFVSTLNLSFDDYYWSSTEYNEYDAWFQNFSDGSQEHSYDGSKQYLTARVRPIRIF